MLAWLRSFCPPALACMAVSLGLPVLAAPAAEAPVAGLQQAYTRAVAPGEQADLYRDLFPEVFQRLQRSHFREVDVPALAALAAQALEPLPPGGDPREVFNTAVNAALRTLDNYTRYIDPLRYRNERGESSGSFGGLGLRVEPADGAVRVVSALPDTPAARAGLREGDLILQVDDLPLASVPLSDAIGRMRGDPGTAVSLRVRRVAEEFTVALTRDTIRTQPLRWSMEGSALVIRVSTFSAPVGAAVENAIAEATAQRMPQAVVLDVRGNPGGLLREAVRTADAFLSRGEIVSVRGRTADRQRSWQADADELLPGLPMVVLVDRHSASAAELLAAALQENGRAVVMGQRSYGKASVQVTYPLGEGKGAVKVTTSAYHGPLGRSVAGTGVQPDIELAAPSASSREAPGAAGDTERPRIDPARCAALASAPDPALACAIAYLLAGDAGRFTAAVADVRP